MGIRDYLLSAYFAAYRAYGAVVDYVNTILPALQIETGKRLPPKARNLVSQKSLLYQLEGLERLLGELYEFGALGRQQEMEFTHDIIGNVVRGALERAAWGRRIHEELGLDTHIFESFEAMVNDVLRDADGYFERLAAH